MTAPDRRHSHATRDRIADVLTAVSGLEMQEALAEATPLDAPEHRICSGCGEPAVAACDDCGAAICADRNGACAKVHRGDLICWSCFPPVVRCDAPLCPKPALYSSPNLPQRCLHHWPVAS